MFNNNQSSLLHWLIGVFMIAAIGKGVFWYCFEREDFKYNQAGSELRQTVPKLQANAPPGNKPAVHSEKKMNYPNGNPMFKEGSFTLKINLPLNEETTVHYVVPVDVSGKPLPSASNIVFYAPYNGEAKRIAGGINNPWHRYFPETLGFTIFTMTIEANTAIVYDKKQYYIYKECGWHDIVFNIQQNLTKTFNLSPKSLLVFGESSGGSMAQQMAALYPDRIAAAAWNGGTAYEPFKKHSKVAWLALSTWGCKGIPETIDLKKQAEQYGMQVLRGECPPVKLGHFEHHAASDTAHKLINTFFRDIIKLRDRNFGKVPPSERWPVTETVAGGKQYFPSSEFAELWQQLPHEATEQIADGNTNNNELIVFSHSDKADRIVFFVQDAESSNLPMLQDNLYSLAQIGAIPITGKLSHNHINDISRFKQQLATILAKDEWKTLPVFVIGDGVGGQLAAVAALSNGDQRIKRITTLNAEYESPFGELSIATHRSKSKIPLKLIYATADSVSVSSDPNTKVVFMAGAELEKQSLSILAEASRGQ